MSNLIELKREKRTSHNNVHNQIKHCDRYPILTYDYRILKRVILTFTPRHFKKAQRNYTDILCELQFRMDSFAYALKTTARFATVIKTKEKKYVTDLAWVNIVKSDLNNYR